MLLKISTYNCDEEYGELIDLFLLSIGYGKSLIFKDYFNVDNDSDEFYYPENYIKKLEELSNDKMQKLYSFMKEKNSGSFPEFFLLIIYHSPEFFSVRRFVCSWEFLRCLPRWKIYFCSRFRFFCLHSWFFLLHNFQAWLFSPFIKQFCGRFFLPLIFFAFYF